MCVCVYVCLYAYRHPYNPYIMSHESWSTVVLWNWLMPVPACQAKHLELEWSSLQFLGTSGQTQIKCCMHMPYAYAYVNRLYTCIYIYVYVCVHRIYDYICAFGHTHDFTLLRLLSGPRKCAPEPTLWYWYSLVKCEVQRKFAVLCEFHAFPLPMCTCNCLPRAPQADALTRRH